MLNQNNDLQTLLAEMPLDDRIDVGHRERLEQQLLAAFVRQRNEAPSGRFSISGSLFAFILRHRAGFATATAGLALLVSLLLLSSPRAYAINQTIEALSRIHFLHVVMVSEPGGPIDERWIEVGTDGRQIRYRQQSVEAGKDLLIVDDGENCLLYDRQENAATFTPSNGQQYQWIGNLHEFFQKMADDRNVIMEKDVEQGGRKQHHVWWPQLSMDCYVDADSKLPTKVGPWQVSYETPPPGVFDCIAPEGAKVVDQKATKAAAKQQEDLLQLLGQCKRLLASGDYEQARAGLEKVVQGEPKMNWAWFWLGMANERLGNPAAAIDAYTHVIDMFAPYHVIPHYCHLARALAYRKVGDDQAAQRDLAIALPVMIHSLTHLEGTELFEYADKPLLNQNQKPSQAQLFQRMVERLRLATGADVQSAATDQAAVAEAWRQWWAGHAADYGINSSNSHSCAGE